MKNYKVYLLIIVIGLFNQYMIGQEINLTSKDSIVQSSWIVGLGINIVDDSGDAFGNLFATEEQWNMVSHPSRLSIGKYFKNGLGIEAIGTYNKYKVGKTIDGVINTSEKDYLGLDARVTYDLNKILGETGFFDPYVGIGAGYTDANDIGRGTYNAIVGFRAWFSDNWGVDLNSSGKWSMGNDATNHLQYAAGVVYQFGIEKGLSKKGLEKLAMLHELEKEKLRIQDSISTVKKAEEQMKALADKLAKEKEATELVKAEREAEVIFEQKKKEIKSKVKKLGYVYYNFNSSYLTNSYKKVLDSLVIIMEDYPNLKIKISSHTDSRGNTKYNQWLSERRLERIINYVFSKGIDNNRVMSEAFGEHKLINNCDDSTYCPEEKHKKNRRSEINVFNLK